MKKLCLLVVVVLAMAGCGKEAGRATVEASDASDSSSESTVDFVRFEEKQYVNAWELSITDQDSLREVGEVERGSRLPEGSLVYEISGYPEQDVIAVKDDGEGAGLVYNRTGYAIYVLFEGADRPSHYPAVMDKPVSVIRIYKGAELLRSLEGEEVGEFQSLLDRKGPNNEFQTDRQPQFTALFVADGPIGYQYGVLEKDGEYGLAHIESKLPADMARFFAKTGSR